MATKTQEPEQTPNGWYSALPHPKFKHLLVLSDHGGDIRLTANGRYLSSELRNNEAPPEFRWTITLVLKDDPSQVFTGQGRTNAAAYEAAESKIQQIGKETRK